MKKNKIATISARDHRRWRARRLRREEGITGPHHLPDKNEEAGPEEEQNDAPEEAPSEPVTEKKESKWLDIALDRASAVMRVGSEAADVIVHLQRPTPMGLAAVGMRVIDSVRKVRAKKPADYFGSEWKKIYIRDFKNQAYRAIYDEYEMETVSGLEESGTCVITQIDGIVFGWSLQDRADKSDVEVEEVWIKENVDVEKALQILGKNLWEHLGCTRVVLAAENGRGVFAPEPDRQILASSLGDGILSRIKQFQKTGVSRSIFLVGEPGVGKSCLMRYVGSKIGGFGLRIKMGDIEDLGHRSIEEAVRILRPDVLLIDDFDRFATRYRGDDDDIGFLLDTLEEINRNVKLFMVSANYDEGITDALLRPGRFDEIHSIEVVDEAIVDAMLEGCPAAIKKKICKLPIAHIEEFSKRMKVLGFEAAFQELKDLIRRTEHIINLSQKKQRKKRRRILDKAATHRGRASQYRNEALRLERRALVLQKRAETQRKYANDQEVKAEREKERTEKKKAAAKKKKKKAPRKASKKGRKKKTTRSKSSKKQAKSG